MQKLEQLQHMPFPVYTDSKLNTDKQKLNLFNVFYFQLRNNYYSQIVMGTEANLSHAIIIQQNSVNTVTNVGCINWVAVLTRVFYKKMYGGFARWQKKNYPNNEVAVRQGFNVLLFCTSPYCMPLLAQYYAIFELNLKILFFLPDMWMICILQTGCLSCTEFQFDN